MIEQNRIDADNNSEIENRNESVKDKKQQKREKRNARLAKIKALFKGCSMRLTVHFIL